METARINKEERRLSMVRILRTTLPWRMKIKLLVIYVRGSVWQALFASNKPGSDKAGVFRRGSAGTEVRNVDEKSPE